MALLVVSGALILCRCGTKPSRLNVTPSPFLPNLSIDLPTVDFSLDFSIDLPTGLSLDFSMDLSLAMSTIQTPAIMLPQFGVFEEFYLDGGLAVQANFEAGLLEGPCLVFDMDGGIVANLNFHRGLPEWPDLPVPDLDIDLDFDFDVNPDIGGAFASSKPMATVKDHAPYLNIPPFGLCKSSGNPAVTAAGKPVPCTPKTETPWIPGSTMYVSNTNTNAQTRVLTDASILTCAYGCVITVLDPGQSTVTVP